MKQFFTLLLLLVITATTYAQGISVQGIARDNTNAAITNENLPFTFSIVNGSSAVFTETQQIRTDNFGLFSHVLSSGTTTLGNFNTVDFSITNLKLQVTVNYSGGNVLVYDQELQYVPYAHYATKAANGVPPGTVVAFLGDDNKIPDGWVKADGRNISGSEYTALRNAIGNTLPDLRGRFLKGNGSGNININAIDESTPIRGYQDQSLVTHGHSVNINTNTDGAHGHHNVITGYYGSGNVKRAFVLKEDGTSAEYDGGEFTSNSGGSFEHNLVGAGGSAHSHKVSGDTSNTGGEENRPWTVIVNYIIKL